MFERYPRESVQVLLLAKAVALAAGEAFIDSKHLLAGAVVAAPHLKLPSESILRVLQLEPPIPQPEANGPDIQFGPAVVRMLQEAMALADRLGHHRIRPEHMLLALLEEPDCPAREALRAAGCERHSLVESAMRSAAADDSPLSYTARLELHVVPDGITAGSSLPKT